MYRPKLFFRVDGSTQIGLGHLVRCQALAAMLSDIFEINFYCKLIPDVIQKQIRDSDFNITLIDDEKQFFDKLKLDHIVVIDGYQFDKEYQKKVKKRCKSLVCIDDLVNDFSYADVIINQSPGIHETDYQVTDSTIIATGPEFAMLRPSFLNKEKKFAEPGQRNSLLICFGGSDVKNHTERVLNEAIHFNQFEKITIITGIAYQNENKLLDKYGGTKGVVFFHNVDEKKMAELMVESDVAIVPASGILYEAFATKNIIISGMYVDNQSRIYKGFKQMNAFIDAGTFQKHEIIGAFTKIQDFEPVDVVDSNSPQRFKALFELII